MAKHESDVVLRFKTDGEVQYAQTVKEINQVMNTAAKEYKAHISALGNDAEATQKLAAQQKKLQIQTEAAEKRTKLLRQEYEESVKATGENSKESKKLYDRLLQAETAENNLRNALDKTNKELKEQEKASKFAAENIKKIGEAGEKVKGVGEKLSIGVTAPILAIGTAGFKIANELSTSQTKIQAAFNLTEQEAQNLNKVVEDVFASGMVSSVDEANESVVSLINQLPVLKLQSSDTISAIVLQAKALEETFGSDMEETMRGVNALMTTYGMTAQEAMDYITTASQHSLDKTHELGDNLAEYAVQFQQNGYSAKEMFEILESGLAGGAYNLDKVNDLVKEMGIRISDGSIQSAVETLGGEWQSMYEQMSASGASNNEIFDALVTKISEVGDETEKATLVSTIFGSLGEDNAVQVLEAMTGLSQEMTGVKGSYDNVTGSAEKMKNKIEETVTYQSAMNEVMLAFKGVGEIIAPYISQFADIVKNLANWFKSLDSDTQKTIVTIAGIAAAVGPVLVVLGTLASSISSLIPVIAFIASPIGLVIAAIAAWVAAIVIAYNKVGWFRDFINTSFKVIKDIVVGVFKVLADTTKSTFDFITGFIGGAMDGAVKIISDYVNAITRIFGGIIDFVTGVFTGDWSRAWQGVVDIFGGIFEGIAAVAKAPINAMITLINGFLGGLSNIKIPKWVPGFGGKKFSIAQIPYLAEGGHMINGQAIVGEAGPELLTAKNGKTTVTPLSQDEKSKGISGALNGNSTINNYVTIGQVDANNPSEINRLNRKMFQANVWNNLATGDV
ncbi:phage tail tape measure protein [Enterococcus faecalis]|uniref:phage tail tape measure protein n=2 Tax=Enterococcus faecalis TaxID=1351 RepID=UPI000F4FBF5E|nr:phage tail tape measure protein [Enterococcus faecalis]ROW81542.1 phage tail tape measure protein [Enterococcus faecalis]ROX23001.1 phage tail tape measure protein [Enterococcus faecalis]ROY13967.1 phage tail tape measure protein [Enterococcus faecalis]ROY33956.1 phage tail tape measure protein [Enterococcus faecalis]ROY95947.1 phage tail tape measure protein [Enterococcus faecalis]